MQCFFKHALNVSRSKNLNLKQKIDGLLLLNVYFMPLIALVMLLTGVPLVLAGSPLTLAFWFSAPIFLYSFVGNFAPFFKIEVGAYLDGRKRTQWLIPLLILTFFYNIAICMRAFFDVISSKTKRKDNNIWVKTRHLGDDNNYIGMQL